MKRLVRSLAFVPRDSLCSAAHLLLVARSADLSLRFLPLTASSPSYSTTTTPHSPTHSNPTMAATTNTSTTGGIADKVEQGASYVAETAKELGSGASKEANKEQAKDSNQSAGDRVSGAAGAVSDKVEETVHGSKADAHKEAAKH